MGVDILSNTPIVDIKPYVPHYDSAITNTNNDADNNTNVSLPSWVTNGLHNRKNVTFTANAYQELKDCISFMELYDSNELSIVKSCIVDILSVDIRSIYQTNKQSKNEFKAHEILNVASNANDVIACDGNDDDKLVDSTDLCTQQIDNLLIHFHVMDNQIEVRHIEVLKLLN